MQIEFLVDIAGRRRGDVETNADAVLVRGWLDKGYVRVVQPTPNDRAVAAPPRGRGRRRAAESIETDE